MSVTTMWNVLNNNIPDLNIKRGIIIPMIQRDYAQGRKNKKANEIRKIFLNNILDRIENVVCKDELPLELDFIYGYIENEFFIPLDGQQRLTTLYLLYWYFAFKEHLLVEYKMPFSNFNYQTRQSSEDFIRNINNKLTRDDHNEIFNNNKLFSSIIEDKNWYFVNWKYDLTIQSAIVMLDEIHLVFSQSKIQFSNLIDRDKPCIIFNFLNIEKFGLSDSLYIKMNARGKPLTNFENLKAELGQFIVQSSFNKSYNYTLQHKCDGVKPVDVETYFVTKIDTTWSDYFWKIRNKKTNEYDDKLLNLLAFVSLNQVVREDTKKFDSCINKLFKDDDDLTYYEFKTLGLLNEINIIDYIDTIDLFVTDNEVVKKYLNNDQYIVKGSIISSAFEKNYNARYEQRIMFYAIFKFLNLTKNNLNINELNKWDRIVRNLTKNTIFNNSKEFYNSIMSIDSLVESYNGDVYETLLLSDISGFDTQQIREEKLKIKLIKCSNNWGDIINLMEDHPYLNGQIMLLLSFSGLYDKYLNIDDVNWNEESLEVYRDNIKLYFSKFNQLFDSNGLRKFDNELFRRALLTKGDYRLYSSNWSLLIDNHRDISWKRLFKETGNKSNVDYVKKCNYLKNLFDEVNLTNVVSSLNEIVKNNNCVPGWRKDFIENPILIINSINKYFKFLNGNVYALRKSKYNKYEDPEIKSILLKENLLKNGFNETEIGLGYIDNLGQYGIVRIKNKKPQVVYNHDGKMEYIVKQKGKDDYSSTNHLDILNYIIANFNHN